VEELADEIAGKAGKDVKAVYRLVLGREPSIEETRDAGELDLQTLVQALLVAQSRAEALERARELEVLAQARAQHAHFFGGARSAHPEAPPWP